MSGKKFLLGMYGKKIQRVKNFDNGGRFREILSSPQKNMCYPSNAPTPQIPRPGAANVSNAT